jgi:uncharacterized membrane protein YkvA (DUF1232 family)
MRTDSSRGSLGNWNLQAIMRDLAIAWRLLWDPRTPALLKLILPVAALIYWIFPIDLMPGLPFDDIAVLILALRLFVQLAPASAVRDADNTQTQAYRADDENTIDTTWRVVDSDQ